MNKYKKFINLLLKINQIFQTNELFCFSKIKSNGKFNLNELLKNKYSLLDFNVNDISGEYVFINKFFTDDLLYKNENIKNINLKYKNITEYDIKNDMLLSDMDFIEKHKFLVNFIDNLWSSKKFFNLINPNYHMEINNQLMKQPLARDLNNFLLACNDEEIEWLDQIGFNPILLINKGVEYEKMIQIFEQKMKKPYMLSNHTKDYIKHQLYNLSLMIFSYSYSEIFENKTKYQNETKEIIKNLKVFSNINKLKISGVKKKYPIYDLNDFYKTTIKISTKNGKNIKDKRPYKHAFLKINNALEENKISAFFAFNIDKKDIFVDFMFEKKSADLISSEERKKILFEIIKEIMAVNITTYKNDCENIEKNFPNTFKFILRNSSLNKLKIKK